LLSKDQWPATCNAAVEWLIENLDEKKKIEIKTTPKADLIKYHRGWGMGIRNNFGLWRGNKTLLESCLKLRENEQFHPDSASMILIEEMWARLNGVKW
jgi:hypothetical protein